MPSAPRGDSTDRVGRVTIVDVARRAGVSKSTVSLVLSGSELVAEATKLRVNEAMGALGYVYHRGAASLRAASSDLVGMIMGDLNNPFFAELTRGSRTRSFNVALRRSWRTPAKTPRARRRCCGRCASTTSPASS
jgi:Transcriptional regulators